MFTLRNAEFVTTVAATRDLPPAQGAEVAFIGRSNAGKSSALNAITGRRRLAFVSKTPGRTQYINFYRVAPGCHLVDLPGYGYAAAPTATRAQWNALIGGYLQTRKSLLGVVLILDARRGLTALDRQLIAWLKPAGRPLHVLLSKSDQLGRRQANAMLHDVESALRREGLDARAQLFSSTHKMGIVEAADRIEAWLAGDTHKKPPVKGE